MSSPVLPQVGAPTPEGPQTAPWAPGQYRPLDEKQQQEWESRVERGIANDKLYHPQWERGLKRYAQALTPSPGSGDDISALLDYRHTEGSKASLFHQTPDVNLIPVDPQDMTVPYQVLLPLREKVLNFELGPERADAQSALHKTLIDTITASGYLICEVGYEQVALPAGPDPLTGMVPTNPDGTPAEIPIWSRRFVSALSSKRLVIPADFHDTDFDKSPWIGERGLIPLPEARRLKWQLPSDFEGTKSADKEQRYDDGSGDAEASEPQCEYTKIWYKAYLYDPAVFNPELYRCLILVKGLESPAWHVDSPYQTLTDTGQLTDDSMIGNPIHVATIRDLIDSAKVPSDLVIIEKESIELDKFRTGLVRNRRARRPITVVNNALGPDVINKMTINDGPVPIPEEYFDGSNASRAIAVSAAATEPRDNYTAQQIIEHDVELAVGRSANQGGQFASKKTTATEAKIVQGNSKARAKTDEQRVRQYFMKLVRKFDAVLQRTMTQAELQKILGQQGAALWEQWRVLPGQYSYKIQPDSGRFVDSEEMRVQAINEYNIFRKDPLLNAPEFLRQVLTKLGYDAGKLVPQDSLPEKPDKPKVSISFSAEQALLSPAEAQLMLSLLEQSGFQIDPAMKTQLMLTAQLRAEVAAMTPNPEHGGSADRTEPVNKHQTERTGGTPGIGRVS